MPPQRSDCEQWTENRPTHGRRALRLGELWTYRELVAFLALRDVKVRYKQAVFGGAWAVLQPLAGAAIFAAVFGRLARVPSDGIPYLVFAFASFSLWTYVSTAVNAARGSLVKNSALVTKVYFPRLAAPLASVLPGLIDLLVALAVLAMMMVWAGLTAGIAIIAAPVFLAGAVCVAFGTGTLLAALTVQYRDVEQVFGFLIQLWFFATPVVYPSSLVTGQWRWVYHLNPMVGVMEGWRWSLLGGPLRAPELLLTLIVTALLLVVGLQVFQRTERKFADVI
ncbi:MAG: ABC transporter permease [Actinomycetota bacterium]|nr:ABC transporter permease [Actinomycetota bacterium]